jgi:hypothetical protein
LVVDAWYIRLRLQRPQLVFVFIIKPAAEGPRGIGEVQAAD